MSIPEVSKVKELQKILEHNHHAKHGLSFKDVVNFLALTAKGMAPTGFSMGMKYGLHVSAGVLVGHGHVGFALNPISAALGVWLVAYSTYSQNQGIMDLHDLLDIAKGSTKHGYKCTCKHCKENLEYIIEKRELNVAKNAIGVFTFGFTSILEGLNEIRVRVVEGKNRKSVQASKGIIDSARGSTDEPKKDPCLCAIATVLLLAKDPIRATAMILADDGYEEFRATWAGLLSTMGPRTVTAGGTQVLAQALR